MKNKANKQSLEIHFDDEFLAESKEIWKEIIKNNDILDTELEECLDNFIPLLNFILEEKTDLKTKEDNND